ncbi:hypothetical protein [Ferrovibrio sp.]|uniref:hypothetical protein n=1 Tax=Ferrovibrio sp. TaxID=1917215 RepID=UPI003D0B686A
MHSVLHLLILALLCLVLPATTTAQPTAGETKSPAIGIETQGNLTNFMVVDPDLTEQAQKLQVLRALPDSADAVLVPWLQLNAKDLLPAYSYELARRLWNLGRRDDALEWYARGFLHARYDAMRCTDTTAGQGVAFLPQLAPNVVAGIQQYRAAFGAAGLRALQQPDLFASTVSPWWICSHGMAAMRAGLQNQTMSGDAWLKPESEWAGLRASMKTDMTRFFEEQSKPQDDPIPMSAIRHSTMNLPPGSYGRFAWLNTTTLLVEATEQRENVIKQLRLDQPQQPLEEVARIQAPWCAGGSMFTFRSGYERLSKSQVRLTFRTGTLNSPESISFETGDLLRYADMDHSGNTGHSLSTSPWRQSPFDCRWVKHEGLSGANNNANWIPLLPGHGFLSFTGADGQQSQRVLHFASETAAPVELPIPTTGLTSTSIKYSAFRNAYFIAPIAQRPKQGEAVPQCRPYWWLNNYGKQRVEEVCLPTDALDNQGYGMIAPSRDGILRAITSRPTAHGDLPGGVYRTGADGRSEKIYEGRVWGMSVSPSGCTAAIRLFPSSNPSSNFTLLALCPNNANVRR